MTSTLITFSQSKPGRLIGTLNLGELFGSTAEHEQFSSRLSTFLAADPYANALCQLKGNNLVYQSEQLIPEKTDRRPPLLLVLGNPATHSVAEGMFFAFEGNGREHRFWKGIMRPSGILDMPIDPRLPWREQNSLRRERLLKLDYHSPFRIGLCVFFSFPSPASGHWSGISGLRRLFGAKAMRQLVPFERQRILKSAKDFLTAKGKVVAFQKNAWEGLRSEYDPEYSIDRAKSGELRGKLKEMPDVFLCGVPPTRLAGPCREALKKLL